MPGPDKSKVKPDLTMGKKSTVKSIDKKSKINFRQHTHPLPLCSSTHHDPACTGVELSCVQVMIGYDGLKNRPIYGAFCSHFNW